MLIGIGCVTLAFVLGALTIPLLLMSVGALIAEQYLVFWLCSLVSTGLLCSTVSLILLGVIAMGLT